MTRYRGSDGFSLFEVMTVVLILGILMMIVIASYGVATARARIVTCQANQRVLNSAVMLYEAGHQGHSPAAMDDLKTYVDTRPGFYTGGVFEPRCPLGTPLIYDATSGVVTCPNHPAQ